MSSTTHLNIIWQRSHIYHFADVFDITRQCQHSGFEPGVLGLAVSAFTNSASNPDRLITVACFIIQGAENHKNYIASQGPLPHTILEFWQMLWQYNISVIVMVCREIELGKKKCER